MLDNVIDANEDELDNYNRINPFVDILVLKQCCDVVRLLYYDSLYSYIGGIYEEDFYYNIPTPDRRDILQEITRIKTSSGMSKYTYNAILKHSVSSLELLMLEEYENVIEGECNSLIFSIKIK